MRRFISIIFLTLLIACNGDKSTRFDFSSQELLINQSIEDWDKAWNDKDVALALKHYSDDIDWTNAFGHRVLSKKELRELLTGIFEMEFVMAGENNYKENDISFLSDSTAAVRSLNIRENQRWPDGRKMDDRSISHLRIYQRKEGRWLITHHMISQAWPTDIELVDNAEVDQ
ncbi:YybH family protein [Membranihabitans marinus]|uniref:YybH family protein n=1 Tax=Membranihabitans marinus TaxID=1227546 RepID=UPI001F36A93F|nr:SgcJ/EcaC family oxidoreductase [Membranihabitans marinus]